MEKHYLDINQSQMIHHSYLKIEDAIIKSLELSPNNKKCCLVLDNNRRHSGYIQWSIIQNHSKELTIQNGFRERKSSIVKLYDVRNNLSSRERKKELERIHYLGQKYISDIVDTLSTVIHSRPSAYQAKIIQYVGLDVEKGSHKNMTGMTILNLMTSQGIIKRYKDGRYTKFRYMGGVYRSIKYTPPNKYASKLEALFANYLLEKDYDFDQQVIFKDLKCKNYLRIDFRVILKENLYVEIDGIQHYKHISYFHTKEEFIEQCRRDKLKDKYMKDNGLHFLRIRYDQDIIRTFENYIQKERLV